MSTSPFIAMQGTDGRAYRLAATLKRWQQAHNKRRIERAAIAALCSMSDLQLKDIGLTRTEITSAARGEAVRHRSFRRY